MVRRGRSADSILSHGGPEGLGPNALGACTSSWGRYSASEYTDARLVRLAMGEFAAFGGSTAASSSSSSSSVDASNASVAIAPSSPSSPPSALDAEAGVVPERA